MISTLCQQLGDEKYLMHEARYVKKPSENPDLIPIQHTERRLRARPYQQTSDPMMLEGLMEKISAAGSKNRIYSSTVFAVLGCLNTFGHRG